MPPGQYIRGLDFETRFAAKVDTAGPVPQHRPELGECHVWIAKTVVDGYGRLKVAGKMVLAHRAIYAYRHGPIPEDKLVLHYCDNRLCQRDSHHFLGTHQENIDDMKAKNRQRSLRGEESPRTQFSDKIVDRVFELRDKKLRQVDIAKQLGMSQPHVSEILRGVSRQHARK